MKKLVRDKIPEIIEFQGRIANIEKIKTDDEYYDFLSKKLQEEIDEFFKVGNIEEKIEELADIFEVIDALCDFDKIDKNLINSVKLKKFKERGGFSKRILLIKE